MYQLADAGGLHTGPAEVVLSTRAGLDEDPVACWPSQPRTRHPHLPQPPPHQLHGVRASLSGSARVPGGQASFLSGLIPVNFIDHTKRPSKTTTTRPSMPYLLPSDHGDSAVTMRSCQQLPAEDAQ
jgi:hypothetical protein